MKLIPRLLLVAGFCLLLSQPVILQPKRDSPSAKRSLTAKEVASRFLPSVVLIVCDDGKGGISQGSGFFVGPGQILTNYHVIENMQRGQARSTSVGSSRIHWIKQVLYTDRLNDLALLSIIERPSKDVELSAEDITELTEERPSPKGTPLPRFVMVSGPEQVPSLKLAESSIANLGDPIYVLSNPEGLAGTISQGIVSGGIRKINGIELLQIDASISSGSSGGPVLNAAGEVVGVATGSLKDGQNLNFAIPGSSIRKFLDESRAREGTKNYSPSSTVQNSWMIETNGTHSTDNSTKGEKTTATTPTNKPISQMTYDEARGELLATLKASSFKHSDKYREAVSTVDISGCTLTIARSILANDRSVYSYRLDLRDIGEFGFTTFSKDVVMSLNLELTRRILERTEYGLLDAPFEAAFTNEIKVPVQVDLEEASRILLKFRRLKETCTGARAESGRTLSETTNWLTERIQGTSSFTSNQTTQYKTIRFSDCNMVLVKLVSGEVRVQYSYQPSLRNMKTVEVTKNSFGNWGIWLEFARNFDETRESLSPYGNRETVKKDKLTFFFDTYEKAKRAGTAFARVLELCGEETKEPF